MRTPSRSAFLSRGSPGVRELIERGTRFDKAPDGTLAFATEGAHGQRILHARGDGTGAEIASVLAGHVQAEPRITVLEQTSAIDLIVPDGRCLGCWLLMPTGEIVPATARACVLATGGVGQLYKYTTNPWVASADGPALAYRAGATLIDMEFIQFHPTALAVSENPMVLVSEAVRGEGARLIDDRGERFMVGVHPQMELAPRDIVARAIFARMQAGRKVFLGRDRHRASIRRAVPHYYPGSTQARDRSYLRADTRHACCPLHYGGRPDRHVWTDHCAWTVCVWRDGLHRSTWRQPTCEQLAF